MLTTLLDAIWPPRCAACDSRVDRGPFCPPCGASLVRGTDVACPRCGGVYLTPPVGGGDHLCGACLSKPPPWTRAVGAYAYGGALRDAVVRWKSRPDHPLGPDLVDLMVTGHEAGGWEALSPDTVVVPVPSPRRQLARRGFNPAGLLARGLARRWGWRLIVGLEVRGRKGSSRGLSRSRRQHRLRGVFRGEHASLRHASVLLVDDVMTTGATARAATRACRRAGASSVAVAVLARAPLDP